LHPNDDKENGGECFTHSPPFSTFICDVGVQSLWTYTGSRRNQILRLGPNIRNAIALLNLFKDLFAVNGNVAWGTNSQPHLLAAHFQNRDLYVIADHDTLIRLAS